MFDYVVQNPVLYRRRHAMKPDEATFLKRNPPKLNTKASCRESCYIAHYLETQDGGINQKAPGSSDGSSSAMVETLQDAQSQAMESGDHSGCSVYAPVYQQQVSSFERGQSDSSSSSSETMKLTRSDHKRKFGALSEDEDDTNPSATAMDIVHPSEIKIEDDDFDSPDTLFGEDYTVQVLYSLYL
ncbi:MAG: hypothetical protein Q9216_000642 [Gyalolechia sp. 2 TL-2023]